MLHQEKELPNDSGWPLRECSEIPRWGRAGLGKVEGGQKSFKSVPEGGREQKVFRTEEGVKEV